MQTARAPCSRKTTLTPHAWTYLHLSFFLSGLHSELDDTNLKDVLGSIFLRPSQSSSEFPPETRHVLQVETWLLRGGVNLCQPHETPRMLSPAKLRVSKSSEGAPGAPGYGRTWVHLIAFSRCGPKFFFRFFTSHTHLAESTKKAHPLSLASSTARRGAVRCRAVSCPAVQYRALPRCAVL